MSRARWRRWTSSSFRISSWNETANYAHVFLPGATFLEKDGTFTNAERRVQRVRKVMSPKNGYADWEVTQLLAKAMGCDWTTIRQRDHGRDRALTPTSRAFRSTGSTSWAPSNGRATTSSRKACRSCTSTNSRAARASSSSPNMSRRTSAPDRASRCC
ncbi:molybdopterin-dependent oxidoreductase [Methylocystis parvus]|uniref:molybdopterin-dependent oxidoreductase n=1 Tax=Methylocystis parvus TaxID=134 RepID=UPI003C72979E